ncbi:unnamed protein product [Mycena citricolor]|uniref:Xylanolytic transcriptional activator regulatory domain-containing protein n=1 Tax=Mycena citricolor TaxID=2018698 RepID=A0AAD2GUT8_9AGAR|nr:unnamed protein product [Mycena citricolor]
MEARKHSLEDALAILSDKPHPLLNMPETKDDEDAEFLDDAALKLKAVDDASESAVEAIGALHIDGKGVSRFFGPSGGSESLLLQAESVEKQRTPHLLRELDTSYLPPEILHCSSAFPFMPPGFSREPIQEMIESFLPPMGRAVALCETFLEHLSWMFHIVSRRQLFEELIPAIYKRSYTVYGLHDLAVLLITLGIGALVDLEQQPYNLEAQHYYRLARAALMLQSVMSEASIVTIKTLHLMSIYNGLSGKESNMEASYGFLDMACQVALMTGMHIDPSMWGFRGQQAYDRRIYFWNLCVAMLWQVSHTCYQVMRHVLNQAESCNWPAAIHFVTVHRLSNPHRGGRGYVRGRGSPYWA